MSKVQLSGNVNGTGIFTIASPNSNTDRTLTLPDNTGTLLTSGSAIQRSQLPAGSVLQVVQFESTSSFSSTSTSFTNITGFTASITPTSASSKILVNVIAFTSNAGANQYTWVRVLRGGTTVIPDMVTIDYNTYGANGRFITGSKLDSPSTTSSVTYQLQIRAESSGNAARIGIGSGGITSVGATTITLMEIAE